MSKNDDLRRLLDDYVLSRLTNPEMRELERMLDDPQAAHEAEIILHEEMEQGLYESEAVQEVRQRLMAYVDELTGNNVEERRSAPWISFIRSAKFRVAASVLLLVGVAFYFFFFRGGLAGEKVGTVAEIPARPSAEDILPGMERAVLTLSNGQKIELESQKIINDGQISIRNDDGELIYTQNDVAAYNTMSTPRGGQYRLVLADGTHVWLNAASSITFPTAFNGNERRVSISGEAYFEVAKDARRPFRVTVGDKEDIEVLGTHFNVNGYCDEGIVITTLLEGSLQIQGKILQPGQALAGNKILNADINHAIAWKNGYFSFKSAELKTVMMQLSRWYDIEVEYAGEVTKRTFTGEIGRDLTLSQVLKGLSITKINYEIKNGRLIVLP